ncbi:hypothetical protein [Mycolicibacterium vinylchloridicum]|uniref:hypothetical protein n=1 Tax=Mycolicibacterium vinylchloridicum TaxID=2736928 RepID=UPI0015CA2954|nr:hypothetical protein [Mycolicibacterium vinylchloridicum]
MTSVVRLRDDLELTLGRVVASAGEGTIHEVADRPEWVAKIFHRNKSDLAGRRDKLAAMIDSPPPGATGTDGFVVLTWPLHLIDTRDMLGYVMPRIDTGNAVEIHTVSNPSNRMNPLPSAPQWTPRMTWRHLLHVAANLCHAVDVVHRVDAVIGDFQERNILVNDTSRVTLVDCDSIQFADSRGRQFFCGVGRPEFTAPELAGLDLSAAVRDKPSDLFALAIHIHLLLMGGNHPFLRGAWTGSGDQPSPLTLAASADWAGGPGSALHTHPLAPSPSFLPGEIRQLFGRAFTAGARDPSARPDAREWRDALQAVKLTECSGGHQIPVGAGRCPWCAIEAERIRRRTTSKQTVVQDISSITAGTQTPHVVSSAGQTTSASGHTTPTPRKPPRKPKTTRMSARPPKPIASPKPKPKAGQPDNFSEAMGQSLYTLFKIVGIPLAVLVVVMTVWILVYSFSRAMGAS